MEYFPMRDSGPSMIHLLLTALHVSSGTQYMIWKLQQIKAMLLQAGIQHTSH
jgi:hypothetical protein